MEYALLITALVGLAERLTEGVKVAKEIWDLPEGEPVPPALIAKAKEIREAAKAAAHAVP